MPTKYLKQYCHARTWQLIHQTTLTMQNVTDDTQLQHRNRLRSSRHHRVRHLSHH
jgi:hypothetical protein